MIANDDLSMDVHSGTVHAVVGENGAGKTTLMRILAGLDQPDSGTVVLDGEPVRLRGPGEAAARGIAIVEQEPAMVGELTLLENLVLGAEPRRGPLIDWRGARARAHRVAAESGLDPPWDTRAADAPLNARQQVAILRGLLRSARVLILDEPTSALAPEQVRQLFRLLRGLRAAGRTVVFISHKLTEVLDIADVVTVLRHGRAVTTVQAAALGQRELTELAVGEHVPETGFAPAARPGGPALTLAAVAAPGTPGLHEVSCTVRAGEIVGIAGVAGNGQDELLGCVTGLRPLTAGRILLHGKDVTAATVAGRRAAGLGYIAADRLREGLALDASLADNAIAGAHRGPVSRRGLLARGAVRAAVDRITGEYAVRYGRRTDPVRTLSGGNQQRLVLGRELARGPGLLVAAHPTRGVDVQGIAFLHRRLRALRDDGAAVLLVSEELDELLALSDRIVVLSGGRVAGETGGGPHNRAAVGELMLGRGGGR
ncbi:ABC transporter ATP-binding protein [Amycolatopsis aidingensis]|uniref:ABC transporter ATP-binding protein n=1 Tax=Amycolatopsis aidingensis TaxID=2842453 RepID=UPI001C0CF009|nr:ATP-binding cassette domain-containing protein [Amycolatopsis aidingensis]